LIWLIKPGSVAKPSHPAQWTCNTPKDDRRQDVSQKGIPCNQFVLLVGGSGPRPE